MLSQHSQGLLLCVVPAGVAFKVLSAHGTVPSPANRRMASAKGS
jgi:hypothetical protein